MLDSASRWLPLAAMPVSASCWKLAVLGQCWGSAGASGSVDDKLSHQLDQLLFSKLHGSRKGSNLLHPLTNLPPILARRSRCRSRCWESPTNLPPTYRTHSPPPQPGPTHRRHPTYIAARSQFTRIKEHLPPPGPIPDESNIYPTPGR